MKKFVLDFLRRGLAAWGFGPVVLAIIYLILQQSAAVETVTINQVCTGIFSLTALAFIAGGILDAFPGIILQFILIPAIIRLKDIFMEKLHK